MNFLSNRGCCGCCQPNKTTKRRFICEKDQKINALLHLLLEAGGWAAGQPGPHQQGVLDPAGAVLVGGVSPGQGCHSPLLLGASQKNIIPAVAEAALAIALEGIFCDWL